MADPRGTDSDHGYERDVVNVKAVLITASIIVATVLAAAIVNAWLGRGLVDWYGRTVPVSSALRPPAVAGPALQPLPNRDIEAYRAEKHRIVDEYRWLDRKNGVVRIPIKDAMQQLAGPVGKRGEE